MYLGRGWDPPSASLVCSGPSLGRQEPWAALSRTLLRGSHRHPRLAAPAASALAELLVIVAEVRLAFGVIQQYVAPKRSSSEQPCFRTGVGDSPSYSSIPPEACSD